MSVNPNVDRLSIDERLRKLEARFPGGGGGGIGLGAIDFDQYPDNAFKITSDGIVFKISFANISQETKLPTFLGVDLRICCFMPFRYGIPIGPFLLLSRMQYTQNFTSLGTSSSSLIDFNKVMDDADFLDTFYPGNGRYIAITLECRAKTVQQSYAPIQYLNLYASKTGTTKKWQISARGLQGSHNNPLSVLPCTSFGATFTSETYIPQEQLVRFYVDYSSKAICGNVSAAAPSVTVDNPQDLPNSFKPFYPSSWYQ